MKKRDPDAYAEKYWPQLLIVFGACVLWYYWRGNAFAGFAGFAGYGWLAWARLIKPRM